MRKIPVEVLSPERNVVGESPVWRDGAFWWVDIESKLFKRLDGSGELCVWALPERIGCAVPVEGGDWFLCLETGIVRFHPEAGIRGTVVHLDQEPGEYRFNDGKADRRGRLFVGTMSLSAPPMTASFFRLDPPGKLVELLSGIGTSNGLAWSADDRTLYYIDSKTGRIDRLDFDLETGAVSNRRPLVERAPQGRPDGMCIDVEGNLWAGHWDGWAVRCYHGETGECLVEVPLPCARVTSCCFAGERLDQLLITTAAKGLEAAEMERQPGAGQVFLCQPGVCGVPAGEIVWR
ncbi:MAG: SMP-30/gluconolactonase/LRE family protein [Verrucomicrobiia bacterium]